MKKVYVREEYCVACGLCQVYCATQHSQYPDDVLKAFRLSSRKPVPRLLIEKKASLSFAWQCRHCDNAACVSACISGAMSKDARPLISSPLFWMRQQEIWSNVICKPKGWKLCWVSLWLN